MTPSDIEQIVDTIKRENRHTRLVFGGGIIILAIVLMYIAPLVIRSQMIIPAPDITDMSQIREHAASTGKNTPDTNIRTNTTVTSTTTSTSTSSTTR